MRKIRIGAARPEDRNRTDQRFTRLLDAKRRTLGAELVSCVRMLARKGVGINWVGLLEDLSEWAAPGQPVQHAWAESYFKS
jgi:CRISPR type I-E-associated protein CasB/Cse2